MSSTRKADLDGGLGRSADPSANTPRCREPHEVEVRIDRGYGRSIKKDWLSSVVRATLDSEGVTGPSEVSLFITGQETIRQLNRDYRGLDEPTDVLSFALAESREGMGMFALPPDGISRLGDVVISYPQARVQAAERGTSTEQEIALLVVHGVLHLLGYDHVSPAEAKVMEDKETALLDELFHL